MFNVYINNPKQTFDIIDLMTKLAPIFISLATAYVAWQQWNLSTKKLKFDIYQKRFSVYESALNTYLILMKNSYRDVSETEINNMEILLTKSYRESQFLFGSNKTIFNLLKKIIDNTTSLIYLHKHYGENNDVDVEHLKTVSNLLSNQTLEVCLSDLENELSKYITIN